MKKKTWRNGVGVSILFATMNEQIGACSFGIVFFSLLSCVRAFCSAIHDTKATKQRIPALRIKTTSSFTITAVVSDRRTLYAPMLPLLLLFYLIFYTSIFFSCILLWIDTSRSGFNHHRLSVFVSVCCMPDEVGVFSPFCAMEVMRRGKKTTTL